MITPVCPWPFCVPKKGIKPMPPDSNLIEFGGLWFRWDLNKAARNFREHRVRFEQAVRVFADGLAESLPDYDHDEDEDRYQIIGQADGRLLVVAYTYRRIADKDVIIRIISARLPEPWERRAYENE